jgi:hypothetical protein
MINPSPPASPILDASAKPQGDTLSQSLCNATRPMDDLFADLTHLDWTGQSWATQDELMRILYGCMDANNDLNLSASGTPMDPLPASICLDSTLITPSINTMLGNLETDYLHPTTKDTYPPSPSTSGLDSDVASQSTSTASPSPHLLASHLTVPNQPQTPTAKPEETQSTSIPSTTDSSVSLDGTRKRTHKEMADALDNTTNASETDKRRHIVNASTEKPTISLPAELPASEVNYTGPLITPTSMPTMPILGLPPSPSTPLRTSVANNTAAAVAAAAAANHVISAGLSPAFAQFMMPNVANTDYANNPAVWAAAAAAAAAAAIMPSVSMQLQSPKPLATTPTLPNLPAMSAAPTTTAASTSTTTTTTTTTSNPVTTKMAPLDSTGAPKVAITRLPRHNAPPPPPPLPVSTPPANPAARQRKKSAHNAIERRYRTNLNDRIAELRSVVPALCHIRPEHATTAARKGSQDGGADEDDHDRIVDGVPAATRLNKATILRKATEYIIYLRQQVQAKDEENQALRDLLRKTPETAAQLSEWDAMRSAAASQPSKANSVISVAAAEMVAGTVHRAAHDAITANTPPATNEDAVTSEPSTISNTKARTMLAVFAGVCLVYSPAGVVPTETDSATQEHGQVFASLAALPGLGQAAVESVGQALSPAIFSWMLRLLGIVVFIWLLGLPQWFLHTDGKSTRRKTVQLEQRSYLSITMGCCYELAMLCLHYLTAGHWSCDSVSWSTDSAAEADALCSRCEQSLTHVGTSISFKHWLTTFYAMLRLVRFTSTTNTTSTLIPAAERTRQLVAIATTLQALLPSRTLANWTARTFWQQAQHTASSEPSFWLLSQPVTFAFLERGKWLDMPQSIITTPSKHALERLELSCLLARLDNLYEDLLEHRLSSYSTLSFLDICWQIQRLVTKLPSNHSMYKTLCRAYWYAMAGAALAAHYNAQSAAFTRCLANLSRQIVPGSQRIQTSISAIWLTLCAQQALRQRQSTLAMQLLTAAPATHTSPDPYIRRMVDIAHFLAEELKADIYVALYQHPATITTPQVLRAARRQAHACLRALRLRCPTLMTAATAATRVAHYQAITRSLGHCDPITLYEKETSRPITQIAAEHLRQQLPNTPISAAIRHVPRGHAWCRDVGGARMN